MKVHISRPDPNANALVPVTQGEVFDVAVDIRKCSPTFSQRVGEILSADNKNPLSIPEGFAHGYLTLSQTVGFLYKTTGYYAPEFEQCIRYAPEFEQCIRWGDSTLGIQWPNDIEPVLSAKDQQGKPFADAEHFA